MKGLVIVESPAKAKTLHKILGKEFGVKASIGHIKDLPEKDIGVDVNNNFKPHYVVIPGREKVIKELKKASEEAGKIFLAPDPDREGEAIAWHIACEISNPKSRNLEKKIYRVTFNEITERAVREAIKNPGRIDMKKVEAQQSRRILDRLVGYRLSPLLWKKVRRGLSAGRVQSVTVRLIVDREQEIRAFKSEEYWSINAEFEGSKPPIFWARLQKIGPRLQTPDSRFLIPNEDTVVAIISDIKDEEFLLSKIERKGRKRMPHPPFITSTLQQEAVRKLRFQAKKTMMIAQQLYEGIELGEEGAVGLITYMRTDSFRVAPEAEEWARRFIEKVYGRDYIPERPPVYKSKPSAEEAHEAIRPTYPGKRPEDIRRFLSKDQYALYMLIWNRFISSQMAPAELEQTTFIIELKAEEDRGYEFRASGTVVRFDGFMALYTEGKNEAEEEERLTLPALKEGETLTLLNLQPRQHFTQPPPRYTEATLIKALEEKGIGRPSTYITILTTIQDRKYVHKTDGKFFPTELGITVNDFLVERFPELIGVGFTAKMEDELDRIEGGKMEWVKVVRDFYDPFDKALTEATNTLGKIKPKDIPTEAVCEKCGLPMVIRWGRHGRFMACSGFPRCRNTKPIQTEGTKQKVESRGEVPQEREEECKNTRSISTGVRCPQDGGDIVGRRSKKGRQFWGCNNFPGCRFAMWYRPLQKRCPDCDAEFIVEKRDRAQKTYHVCLKKGCGYIEK